MILCHQEVREMYFIIFSLFYFIFSIFVLSYALLICFLSYFITFNFISSLFIVFSLFSLFLLYFSPSGILIVAPPTSRPVTVYEDDGIVLFPYTIIGQRERSIYLTFFTSDVTATSMCLYCLLLLSIISFLVFLISCYYHSFSFSFSFFPLSPSLSLPPDLSPLSHYM